MNIMNRKEIGVKEKIEELIETTIVEAETSQIVLKAWEEYQARVAIIKKEGYNITQKNDEKEGNKENNIKMQEIEIRVRGTKRKAFKQITKESEEEKKTKKVMEHIVEVLMQETYRAIAAIEKQKKQPTITTM